MGGRIVALHAGEGGEVAEGQVVVELDDSLLLAQIEMAETELGVAEATLAQVKAGVQQETLDHARAQLEQARAAQAATLVGWEDAQAMLENPQELELALTAARAQLAVLGVQTQQALAMANSAQAGRDLADQAMGMLEDFEPFNVPVDGYEFRAKLPADIKIQAHHQQALATYGSWEAWMGLDQAQAARAGADDYLAELRRQKANPLALQAQVNAAESQYRMATSAIALAQAQVDGLQIGATPEQIAAVEAQVGIARAAREALEVQVDKLILKAPITGLVLERPVHVGEVALPGAPLMTLADLDNVTLTIYVPAARAAGDGAGGRLSGPDFWGHGEPHRQPGGVHAQERADARGTGEHGLCCEGQAAEQRSCPETGDAGGCRGLERRMMADGRRRTVDAERGPHSWNIVL
jgi:multidrug efflux pump subunit AcrA (membrane-fusion protein)